MCFGVLELRLSIGRLPSIYLPSLATVSLNDRPSLRSSPPPPGPSAFARYAREGVYLCFRAGTFQQLRIVLAYITVRATTRDDLSGQTIV